MPLGLRVVPSPTTTQPAKGPHICHGSHFSRSSESSFTNELMSILQKKKKKRRSQQSQAYNMYIWVMLSI